MGEGTGKKKIRRKDGDGKVRLGKHKADQKSNDFMLEIVGFFVYRLASFGFDHNTKDFIWSN